MADDQWPGLRFDPAPGIVRSVDSLVRQVAAAGDQFGRLHAELDRLSMDPAAWQGQAATEFHDEVDVLVPAIRIVKDALFNTRVALAGWSSLLSMYQGQARQLEQQAVEVRVRVGNADKAPGMSMAPHGFEDEAEYARKKAAYTAAKAELSSRRT